MFCVPGDEATLTIVFRVVLPRALMFGVSGSGLAGGRVAVASDSAKEGR